MPLPGNLTTILVTGQDYLAALGAGLTGYMAFTPNTDLADPTAPAIIRAAPQQTTVTTGVMTPVTLACTDNTTLGPSGWAWTITEHLEGAPVRSWSFFLPSTAGTVVNGVRTVDLAALTPLATPPALIQYLTPVNNLADVASEPTAFANIKQPATPTATGVVQLAGDLGGTAAAPLVEKLQGVTLSGTPAAGYLLTATSSTAASWQPGGSYQPWQFYVGTYGAVGDGVTDDTAAIRAAIAAAFSYAQAHGYAEVVFAAKVYLLASAPITGSTFNGSTFQGSAQLPIPAQAQAAEHIVIALVGTRDQTALYNWQQTVAQRAGTILRSTYNAGAALPATGEASVVGGPTPHFMGDPPTSWSNVHIAIDGISIEVPTNPQICGFDFRCMGSANAPNSAVLALSASTGAPQIPDPNWAFGMALPITGNNDECNIGNYSCEGLVVGLQVYEHAHGDNVRLINCYDGLVAFSSSGLPHRNQFDYVSVENCVNLVVLNGSLNKIDISVLDVEWGTGAIIKDVAASPSLGRIGITSNGPNGASLSTAMSSGATAVTVAAGTIGLEITNLDQKVGPVTPPALPASGTALLNPFWRNARVTVAGGTVTQIAVDGVNQLVTSGGIDVPSGHSITLTYSVAPTWAWTLTH